MTSMAAAMHANFSVGLLDAISASPDINVACSPWSVGSALAILARGVDSEARAELIDALAAGSAGNDVLSQLEKDAAVVGRPRQAQDQSILAVANKLWVDEARTARRSFVDGLKGWPGAELRSVSLLRNPEGARRAINEDISTTTKGLIPEILPPRSLTSDDRAILTNALYLLAGWLRPFSTDHTLSEPFRAPSGIRSVPTMLGQREADYSTSDGWAYLSLPLWLGMTAEVVLPPEGRQPRDVNGRALLELRDHATTHRVELHLPQFRLSTEVGLIPALRAVGICRIFDPDLCAVSGVIEAEALFVSAAFHQTVLRVDEKGVEGAAATAIAIATAVALRRTLPEVEMRVDRPFFFLVTHQETGCVLFIAYVAEP